MIATLAGLVLALAALNALLLREHRRLARRTMRLAVLVRSGARHVRAIDWATAVAFDRVHAVLDGRASSIDPERPPKPELLN
jgi:hypothetical protein